MIHIGEYPCDPPGTLAVLLGRPTEASTETVNDIDAYVANFWRAVQADPDEVALWADWPVNEADLHARHLWLVTSAAERVERLKTDPDFFDAKIADWWVWGLCQWIGSGWCSGKGPHQLPAVGTAGRGVHRKLPYLDIGGRGDASPARLSQQIPHVAGSGRGGHRGQSEPLVLWMQSLAERLRRVRIVCGDWKRILGPSVTFGNGVTGIVLDPPYGHDERDSDIYREDHNVAADVRAWAIENGDNPLLRIALCGYDGEHEMPSDWEAVRWKAAGGYGSQGSNRAKDNAARETIWFSPACLRPNRPQQHRLFEVTP